MPRVVSVNISTEKGTVKAPVPQVTLKKDWGIVGDGHGGNWHRQISLLARESIDRMSALGIEGLKPGDFAENITTEGLELHTLPVGTRLALGGCEVEVTQIGKECHHGCAIFQQVGKCIMPTEGIFVKVITEGTVAPGCNISIEGERL
jgi:MOSC domain-containing protein YiiM